MKQKPEPTTRVRFTGAFLRDTGNVVGSAGLDRWQVMLCVCGLCKLGRVVAVNQTNLDGTGLRHIAFVNLEESRG